MLRYNRMIEDHEFKKHTDEALTALQGDLVLAGDDYGFESSLHGGAITISFERPPGKFTVAAGCRRPGSSRWHWGRAATSSIGTSWRMLSSTPRRGQTLKELLEQAISKHLKRDVEL